MAQADLRSVPEDWQVEVSRTLEKGDSSSLPAAVQTGRTFSGKKGGAPQTTAALLRLASDDNKPAELRLNALSALPSAALALDAAAFSFLQAQLQPAQPLAARTAALAILARAKLQPEQREALADRLKDLGPFEAGKLLPVFEAAPTEALGRRVLLALNDSAALPSLQPQALRAVLTKFPAPLQPQAEQLLTRLNVDTAGQKAHLDQLASELPPGDLRRGQLVFNSAAAACLLCHSVGDQGGKFGPDLTSIGQARSERDLLEAIVFPSASFVRSFEPVVARARSGEETVGILRNENSESVTLSTGPGAEQRIARADLAEIVPGTVSLMPPGLDQVLTRQQLADLLAFLKATRWGAQ
jgi:putative heme-binding domain-containing protein